MDRTWVSETEVAHGWRGVRNAVPHPHRDVLPCCFIRQQQRACHRPRGGVDGDWRRVRLHVSVTDDRRRGLAFEGRRLPPRDGGAGRRKSTLHVGSFKGHRPFLAARFFWYNIVGEKRTTPVARHQQESAEESDNFDASRRARTHGDKGKASSPLACVAHAQ